MLSSDLPAESPSPATATSSRRRHLPWFIALIAILGEEKLDSMTQDGLYRRDIY